MNVPLNYFVNIVYPTSGLLN